MSTALIIPEGFKLVGLYSEVQCYGGPEEGGWWYDEYTHIKSEVMPESQDNDSMLEVEEPPSSYICPEGMEDEPLHRGESLEGAKQVTMQESFPGEHDNTGDKRPYYC